MPHKFIIYNIEVEINVNQEIRRYISDTNMISNDFNIFFHTLVLERETFLYFIVKKFALGQFDLKDVIRDIINIKVSTNAERINPFITITHKDITILSDAEVFMANDALDIFYTNLFGAAAMDLILKNIDKLCFKL